jgi:site-specific DNA-methyltransferase (adenine-specific)
MERLGNENAGRVERREMSVTLVNCDCLEFMRTMDAGSVDAVITDPPYGVGIEYTSFDDNKENLEKLVNYFMPELKRITNMIVVTPGNGNQNLYPIPTHTLAFVNMAGVGYSSWGFSCWQPILVYGKDPFLANREGCRPDTFIMKNSGDVDKHNGHPCPKPNNVMRWIIERTTRKDNTIFDPFMGSGTTGVACVQTGRNFIGCEIDEGYFKIAEKRISDAQQQMRLGI